MYAEEKENIIGLLEETRNRILNIVYDARDSLNELEESENIVARAEAYWIPSVILAVTKESEWVGGPMTNLEDTIEEIRALEVEEDDDEDWDDED
jgi:hypothetical protein